MTRTEEFLRGVPLLRGFSAEALRALAGLLEEVRLPAEHVVFRQGDPADRLYIVGAGRLRVEVTTPAGHDVVLAMLGTGHIFGEMALLGQQPRSATVVTAAETAVLAVSKDVFEAYLVANPTAIRELLRIVAQRQQDTTLVLASLIPNAVVAEPRKARLIALVSTKGGVGRTTIATNLAVAFRMCGVGRVALVDCCLQFGDVALLCNVQPR